MSKLSELLHELINLAVPPGNRQGELHDLADEAEGSETAPTPAPKSDGAAKA